MNMKRTEGIVLRRTNYGEADRIVQFITPEGKRSAMAKGVRKAKSKLAGGIELFSIADIVLSEGKGDLSLLTSARSQIFFTHILEDYDRMQFGYEAIKHVGKASELVEDGAWFEMLAQVLGALDTATVSLALIEAWFYIQYAELLGHGLSLGYDIDGQKLDAAKMYMYDVAEKGLRVSTQGDIGADHIKLLRLIATKPIKALAQIGGAHAVLPVCARLARQHSSLY